jgi:hypothetical protein
VLSGEGRLEADSAVGADETLAAIAAGVGFTWGVTVAVAIFLKLL